jgi:Na+/glutamate symporter
MNVAPPVLLEIMPHDPNENMAVSLALAGLSFVVTIIIGRPMVTYLRQRKYGKRVRDELTQHMGKTGTPHHGWADDCRRHHLCHPGLQCVWSTFTAAAVVRHGDLLHARFF